MTTQPTTYKTAEVDVTPDGVLVVRLHSRGDSMAWNALPHREMPSLFAEIARRRDVRVVVITGTGDRFIRMDPDFEGYIADGKSTPTDWDEGLWEGHTMLERLLAIDVPVISAVNGPVDAHAEIALLSDIVICTDDTWFSDEAHFVSGLVPGDGVQIVFPMLLGLNRGRYFLLTGQRIDAEEALALGLVSEVVTRDDLMARAMAHATRLAACNPVLLHNTRRVMVRSMRAMLARELDVGLGLESLASFSGKTWEGTVKPPPLEQA